MSDNHELPWEVYDNGRIIARFLEYEDARSFVEQIAIEARIRKVK